MMETENQKMNTEMPVNDRILYADSRFAVIVKKPGEVCSSNDGKIEDESYIPSIFKSQIEKIIEQPVTFIECVNRIDRPVSGLVLLALTKESHNKLSGCFNNRKNVSKSYWAVVEGIIPENSEPVILKDYIVYHPGKQKAFISKKDDRKSRYAELSYTVCGAGERYSYLKVNLVTGRTHQIRVQLANKGIHIKGDLKYGAKRSDTIPGIRLHAAHLEFTYPGDRQYSFTAPLTTRDPLWDDAYSCFTGATIE